MVSSLSGILESGLHWKLTYWIHHIWSLKMSKETSDPFQWLLRLNGELEEVIIIEIDESLGIGSDKILEEEEKESTKFRFKPKRWLKRKKSRSTGKWSTIYRGIKEQYQSRTWSDQKYFRIHRETEQNIVIKNYPMSAHQSNISPGKKLRPRMHTSRWQN